MGESKFQAELIKKLEDWLPGCIVLKNDPNFRQGIPDLTILWGQKWAALECKKSETAQMQPNQEYYIAMMNSQSYAAFIYPENENQVLHELLVVFARR